MSINHFSSDLPDTLWWTPQEQLTPIMEPPPQNPLISQLHHHHHHHPLTAARGRNTPFDFNLNQEDDEEQFDDQQPEERENEDYEQKNIESGEELIIQKEAMFEKPLTPSDVGKLNRLVIPKQHAEKYFPIGGNGGGDSVEKGLLLSFEDESGKSWRFRYSYWNSSQSYVLTKGWSRFVKEKRLDAGDVVMFKRYRNDGERFFIGWRRRNAVAQSPDSVVAQPPSVVPTGGGWSRVFYSGHPYPTTPSQLQYSNGPPLPYQPECLHAAAGGSSAAAGMQNQTTPSGNSKTVRLFGVNLECQSDEPSPIPAGGSSQDQAHYHHNYSNTAHHSNHHTHMDINFSRDVNQMRFHQG